MTKTISMTLNVQTDGVPTYEKIIFTNNLLQADLDNFRSEMQKQVEEGTEITDDHLEAYLVDTSLRFLVMNLAKKFMDIEQTDASGPVAHS